MARRVFGDKPSFGRIHAVKRGNRFYYMMSGPEGSSVLVIPLAKVDIPPDLPSVGYRRAYLVLVDPIPREGGVIERFDVPILARLEVYKTVAVYRVVPPMYIVDNPRIVDDAVYSLSRHFAVSVVYGDSGKIDRIELKPTFVSYTFFSRGEAQRYLDELRKRLKEREHIVKNFFDSYRYVDGYIELEEEEELSPL